MRYFTGRVSAKEEAETTVSSTKHVEMPLKSCPDAVFLHYI